MGSTPNKCRSQIKQLQ